MANVNANILVIDFGSNDVRAKYFGKPITRYAIFKNQNLPALIFYCASSIVNIQENGDAVWIKNRDMVKKKDLKLTEEENKDLTFQILRSTRYGFY